MLIGGRLHFDEVGLDTGKMQSSRKPPPRRWVLLGGYGFPCIQSLEPKSVIRLRAEADKMPKSTISTIGNAPASLMTDWD